MKNWPSLRFVSGLALLLASVSLSGCGSDEPGVVAGKDEIGSYLEQHPELLEDDGLMDEVAEKEDPNSF